MVSLAADKYINADVYLNAGAVIPVSVWHNASIAGGLNIHGAAIYNLAVADTLEVQLDHGDSTARSTSPTLTSFWAYKIG